MSTSSLLIDDRLLVAHLLGNDVGLAGRGQVHTTMYWYYRACQAATAGGAGQLSGPLVELDEVEHGRAIQAMLQLPEEVGLPEPRVLVPTMAEVSRRHPRLNLMNVEAAAAALVLSAEVLLSPAAAAGVLVPVLDAEEVHWMVPAQG